MLTLLSTVKTRLGIDEFDLSFDAILTNAIKAVTVRFAPAREDRAGYEILGDPRYPQRHAIEHIQPGQVLVMDCRGIGTAANAGDILVSRLQVRGAAGLVLDGGIRDYPSVQAFGFPVYALGPAAPAHVVRHVAVDENVRKNSSPETR